ncbi:MULTISPECIES: enoyl-CoA hydratase [Gammaproteobacteria]|uniref:enoyl-CoA hydratase n=1 Tax=Gammaproteobacteria TaxID=1236 RepID=UPI000DD06E3E|nr:MULTISPECIES: enoyl-CoA hydratase [Gammaproteobacteria]RTE86004.1 enoyl-CoA hydratase [Aliidiomarina sp. B3213]TCZ91358.1 enoyl-CoA hydratase [Lysobacter sp. N42]
MTDWVQVSKADGIVNVHLNRPEKKNALTQDMYAEMTRALREADADTKGTAAVVFSGEGNVFCSGNDLADFLRHGDLTQDSPVFQFLDTISSVTVPVVAKVQGPAVGIGTTLLLHCDLVYAAEEAVFVMPFVDMGLVPEAGSSQLLPLLCGHVKASELLLLGETIDAQKAEKFNIVNKVVSSNELDDVVAKISASLASKPRESLRLSKKLLKAPMETVQERIQTELKDFLRVLASEDTQKIIAAKAQRKSKS